MRYLETKSIQLVRMLNYLGEIGFYDKILKRISDADNWCPFDLVSGFLGFLGNVHPLFYRNFALEYFPKLKEAVFVNILKGPESNVRNFGKNQIELLITAIDVLLKRCFSLGEKYEVPIYFYIFNYLILKDCRKLHFGYCPHVLQIRLS